MDLLVDVLREFGLELNVKKTIIFTVYLYTYIYIQRYEKERDKHICISTHVYPHTYDFVISSLLHGELPGMFVDKTSLLLHHTCYVSSLCFVRFFVRVRCGA